MRPVSTPRPNPDAWRLALAFGAVAWVVGTALLVLLEDQHPVSYLAGEALVPALIATVATAFVTRSLSRRVPWWLYPPVVVGAALAVMAATQGPQLARQHRDQSGPVQHLAPGARIGDWRRDDSPQMRALVDQMKASMKAPNGTTGAVYRDQAGEVLLLVTLTPKPGTDLADEMADPEGFVRSLLEGGGVRRVEPEDPGRYGGSLGCGTATGATGTVETGCTWVAGHSMGFAIFAIGHTDLADAAAQTRDVRERITTVD